MFRRLIYALVVTIILYVIVVAVPLPVPHLIEVIYFIVAALYVAFGDQALLNRP